MNFLKRLFRPPLPPPAVVASTPDEIIATNIRHRIAKDFSQWTKTTKKGRERMRSRVSLLAPMPPSLDREYYHVILNEDESVVIEWEDFGYYGSNPTKFKVNGVPIAERQGRAILHTFDKLKAAKDRADAVAAKAKRDMQNNERKWDLVEEFLGLRRTESGALVPKEGATWTSPAKTSDAS